MLMRSSGFKSNSGLSKKEKKALAGQALSHLAMIVIALAFIVPFLWMLLSSFKTATEIVRIPPTFIPKKFTINNYKMIFERLDFLRYFLNSVLIAGAITVFSMFASSIAGFVFSKFKFRGKELIFVIFLDGFGEITNSRSVRVI